MAIKLPSEKLLLTLHIATFVLFALFCGQAKAQTVLLPGDVVVVSANSNAGTFDFIPLIDIDKGTQLFFANGNWNEQTQSLNGDELKITFQKDIEAGTNLHVNAIEDSRLMMEGSLDFAGDTHHLFSYQKDSGAHRFVFGLAWGSGPLWNSKPEIESASDIPSSLKDYANAILSLGEGASHQYYIKNGASGTRELLLKTVGDASSWRSEDEKEFPVFGTSFNLLTPPVIVFDESMSYAEEGDSIATLAVAIYAHDGSRLTVDVVFDSSRSIINSDDIAGYEATTLNFTGLMGDGIYKVDVPITDDDLYEGKETGIFSLKNLTGGNFGDFLTHSLMVEDNEVPELLISKVVNTTDNTGYIVIRNLEEGVVSLNGWTLSGNDQVFSFSDSDVIYPKEVIKFVDSSSKVAYDSTERVINSSLKKPLLRKKGGNLTLRNYKNDIIYQVNYAAAVNSKADEAKNNMVIDRQGDGVDLDELALHSFENQPNVVRATQPGWKLLTDPLSLRSQFANKTLYTWSEKLQDFVEVEESLGQQGLYLGYFDASEMQKLADWNAAQTDDGSNPTVLSFSISATDKNNNKVIDGVEGLNLIYNSLGKLIPVDQLKEEIRKEYPDITIGSAVYGLRYNSSGELNFRELEDNAKIAPGSAFWISVEGILPEKRIVIDTEFLNSDSDTPALASGKMDESATFGLSLSSGNLAESVFLTMGTASENTSVKDLNSYPDLFLDSPNYLHLAIHQGGDYFSSVNLSDDLQKELRFPINFNSSREGEFTFKVTDWKEIPADWEIRLEDKVTGKSYNLRKDFSVTFDFSNTPRNDFIEAERFVIIVSPPASKVARADEVQDKPRELELQQNYPNPFNPVTTISFYLPETQEVRLSVFNIVGQPVAVITEGTLSAGQHQFEWDATDKPSGMYIYQLEVGKSVMTRKMTLVK